MHSYLLWYLFIRDWHWQQHTHTFSRFLCYPCIRLWHCSLSLSLFLFIFLPRCLTPRSSPIPTLCSRLSIYFIHIIVASYHINRQFSVVVLCSFYRTSGCSSSYAFHPCSSCVFFSRSVTLMLVRYLSANGIVPNEVYHISSFILIIVERNMRNLLLGWIEGRSYTAITTDWFVEPNRMICWTQPND